MTRLDDAPDAEREQAASDPPASEPSSRAAELTAQALFALAAGLALMLVFLVCLNPISITDFWWQAKTGELIVRSGSIPYRDPFSWTAPGEPWMVHEWLTEVFFYLGYTRLPEWVLLGYKAGLAVLASALVMARAWARSRSIALAIGAAITAGLSIRLYADLRPQMVSFVLLAALLLVLDEYREGRMPRLPWALPVLFALWVNLHGGFIVGLIVLAVWVVGEAAGRWVFRQESPGLGPLAAGTAASALAVGINPNGFHVYTYPFHVLGHPQVMDYIIEWYAPDFHDPMWRLFELLLLGTLGALACTRRRRGGDLLVLLALAHAALMARRNTAAFAIAASPVLAAALAELWSETPALLNARRLLALPLFRIIGAVVMSVLISGMIRAWGPQVPPHRWFEHGTGMDTFPRAAVALMKQGAWPGRLYNDYVWGGYLIWELYPHRPVFIDGRAEVYYRTGAFDDEMRIHRTQEGWQAALDRRGVEVVLTRRGGQLGRALAREPGWKLAFTGPVELVFVRDTAVEAAQTGTR